MAGKRLELRLFEGLKPETGLSFGGAMDALTSGGQAPVQHIHVGLSNGGWRATAEEVALDVVHAALFDLAFVLGSARAAGSDQEAVVLGALAVGLLDLGVMPAGMSNGGFEIVDHQALRHAAEELKAWRWSRHQVATVWSKTNSTYWWRLKANVMTKPQVLRTCAGGGVNHEAGVAKVDLGLVAGVALDADGGVGSGRGKLMKEAVDGGERASEAAFAQALQDGGAFDAVSVQLSDNVAVGLD